MDSDEGRSTKPEKAALVAVATNVLLTAAKFVLAAFTASLALLAEAFHSFADIGSSLAVFLALRAERVNSEDRSARFARLLGRNPQRVVAILIGVFLIGVAVSMFRKVLEPKDIAIAYPVPAAIIMLVLALFSFLLSRFERAVGERTGSTALLADGIHAQVDMFGSLLVAIALLGESHLPASRSAGRGRHLLLHPRPGSQCVRHRRPETLFARRREQTTSTRNGWCGRCSARSVE